jgi:hypothetical protein
MLLEQHAGRVSGSYQYRGAEGSIEGAVRRGVLRFGYKEPGENGVGEFRLLRSGRFAGTYTPRGSRRAARWDGHRGWDGIWETGYGRMRLVQEGNRVRGFYAGTAQSTIMGRATGDALAFRYREKTASGEGRFTLAEDEQTFAGEWRPRGKRDWRAWTGRRVQPESGVTWLVVFEAHWQRSLAEPEYSYGGMLREFLARLPQVRLRQRYFHDAASLERWCAEMRYLAEPAILLIASHGLPGGLSVHGKLIDTARVLASLRDAESLRLLHFSSCLVGLDSSRSLRGRAYPVSGYTTSVDWNASALLEFNYLDQILNRGLEPASAAIKLARRSGLGFRFFPAR